MFIIYHGYADQYHEEVDPQLAIEGSQLDLTSLVTDECDWVAVHDGNVVTTIMREWDLNAGRLDWIVSQVVLEDVPPRWCLRCDDPVAPGGGSLCVDCALLVSL